MEIKTVEMGDGVVRIIDQTLLPGKYEIREIKTKEEMWEAIKMLRVRGAPAIGIAAAKAVAVEMLRSETRDPDEFHRELEKVTDYLATSRPTAVNLFWALDRMKRVTRKSRERSVEELKELLLREAHAILEEDRAMCRAIGEAGDALIKDGAGILTHCNAGGLATSGFGTALAPIYVAHEKGKRIRVFADETRPLLQGARLTVWELMHVGVDVTLISDNMAAQVMKEGKIDLVITGADRVAANGDAANKIGTYGVALLARAHGIPFYIAWPASTLDLSLVDGGKIPIEERGKEELTSFGNVTVAPEGTKAYCPAFDVTPHELITAFITDRGLIYPPYKENLKQFAT
ncbi:MAG: S-methyl-5-thioribose-1-phosphate isomerase [Candidatus Euphemobacter frigidus]|nr:S-methyl-5-thioribose-1-phosphate isomerase [Candidatus Euphemobacter frigidus]MDP8275832.1 S-methyl-5-thioribose-1-phosphate isomerase [Candidatus Euphemobacter frigidus]